MNAIAIVVLAFAAVASAGVIASPGYAVAPAPLGYVHGPAPVYHGYGYQVAPVVAKAAIAPAVYASPILAKAPIAYAPAVYAAPVPVVKTAAVAYSTPLLARAAVPAYAPYATPLVAKAALPLPAYSPLAYGAYHAGPAVHYL